MKILLVMLQGIGNTILTTPAIKYLYKRGYILDVVTSNNGSQEILKSLGIVNNIYIYREENSFIENALRLKKEIKDNRYDEVYAMYPNGRRENVLTFCLSKKNKGGIKNKCGYWRMFQFLLRQKELLNMNDHDILSNLKLVGAPDTYQDYNPLIVIPSEIEKEVRDFYLSRNDKRLLFVLHPFSKDRRKCWGLHKYRYICQKLIKEKMVRVIVVGSPNESKIMDILVKGIDYDVEKCISRSILYAAALIKYSNIFVGNDSSLMHIAAALGKPTIGIWGFTDYMRTSPYGENSIIIRKKLDCSPCYSFEYKYRKKCKKNLGCLEQLTRGKVYGIISYIIEQIGKGKQMKDIDFIWDKEMSSIETLWSNCRALVIK